MLTTAEAAEFLGVSPTFLRRLNGGNCPTRREGSRDLVPRAALEPFSRERERKLDELAAVATAEEALGLGRA